MTPVRRLTARVVIGVVLLGCFSPIVFSREAWPFCAYQMFARSQGRERFVQLRLYGVEKGTTREFPLLDSKLIAPFDVSRLNRALGRMEKSPERERLWGEALAGCLKLYEERRAEGKHPGPALKGIRLYRMTWEINPSDPDPEKVAGRDFLAEVSLGC